MAERAATARTRSRHGGRQRGAGGGGAARRAAAQRAGERRARGGARRGALCGVCSAAPGGGGTWWKNLSMRCMRPNHWCRNPGSCCSIASLPDAPAALGPSQRARRAARPAARRPPVLYSQCSAEHAAGSRPPSGRDKSGARRTAAAASWTRCGTSRTLCQSRRRSAARPSACTAQRAQRWRAPDPAVHAVRANEQVVRQLHCLTVGARKRGHPARQVDALRARPQLAGASGARADAACDRLGVVWWVWCTPCTTAASDRCCAPAQT